MKFYPTILVVGAGISFETGIPLSWYLQDLLLFCNALSPTGDDNDYSQLRVDKEKFFKFKNLFKEICDKKEVGISHRAICKSFPKKKHALSA